MTQATVSKVNRERSGVEIDGKWYNYPKWEDTKIPDDIEGGDTVEFEFVTKGKWKNLTDIKLVTKGEGKGTFSVRKGGSWSAYADKEYQQAKDRLIVRQVALKAAVEHGGEGMNPNEITEVAELFVNWINKQPEHQEDDDPVF